MKNLKITTRFLAVLAAIALFIIVMPSCNTQVK